MPKPMLILSALALAASSLSPGAAAEVISASSDHFRLRHEAVSPLPPKQLWRRLVRPSSWWSSDHTYSGDARHLRFEARAGALWREDWPGGSVAHGRVLFVDPGKVLRLEAPFGPLQEMAVSSVWTITLTPEGTGARVRFDQIANGSATSGLDSIAGAVDGVMQAAITRLAAG